jgi:hypothetical protein
MNEISVRGQNSELASRGCRTDQKIRVRSLNALGATSVEEGRRLRMVVRPKTHVGEGT